MAFKILCGAALCSRSCLQLDVPDPAAQNQRSLISTSHAGVSFDAHGVVKNAEILDMKPVISMTDQASMTYFLYRFLVKRSPRIWRTASQLPGI